MTEDTAPPCGFTKVTVLRSKSPVHPAEPTEIATIFWPAPLRIVNTNSPAVTIKSCDGPPDPIDAVADWKRRLAAHEAIKARRLQRIDWYLTQRAAR